MDIFLEMGNLIDKKAKLRTDLRWGWGVNRWPNLLFCCWDKTLTKTNTGGKGLLGFHLQVTAHQKWEQELSRSWTETWRTPVHGFVPSGMLLFLFHTAQDRLLRGDSRWWAGPSHISHQSRQSHRHRHRPTWSRKFSVELSSSQVNLDCVKLTVKESALF